jgi:ADP-ribose pyrophosphatase YjhB (NUDIX family)
MNWFNLKTAKPDIGSTILLWGKYGYNVGSVYSDTITLRGANFVPEDWERWTYLIGEPETHPIPVVAALVNVGIYILMGRRKTPPSLDGKYGIPGGKCHYGETMKQALCREVEEETGMIVKAATHLGIIDHEINEHGHFYDNVFLVNVNEGKNAENREPHKQYGWEWFSLDNPPEEKDRSFLLQQIIEKGIWDKAKQLDAAEVL